jgi:hypothetical protein
MFQEISNDINNSSIQWVLTHSINFWKFRSPSRLQLPKWEFTWECENSFLHTFLHSQEHEMWLSNFPLGPHPYKPSPSRASLLAHTLASLCLNHEPKARVVTQMVSSSTSYFTKKNSCNCKTVWRKTINNNFDGIVVGSCNWTKKNK